MLQDNRRGLIYAFLVWLIPLLASFPIFPLREAGNPLFETVMPVVLALCGVYFAGRYFRANPHNTKMEGLRLGTIWFFACILLDQPLFMWGPMKMTFMQYMGDIGLTYLIYPIISIGMGALAESQTRN